MPNTTNGTNEQVSASAGKEVNKNVSSQLFNTLFPAGLYERMFSTVQDIDMELARDVFSAAEAGNLGDLVQLYINIENSDTRLSGIINTRRSGIARVPFSVEAPEETPRRDEVIQHVKDNIAALRWKLVLKSLMDGRLHGAALFEKVWRRGADGKLWLDSVEPIEPSLMKMDTDSSKVAGDNANRYGSLYIDNLYQLNTSQRLTPRANGRLYITDIDPRKIVAAVNTNRKGYYDLTGVMRPVARWYIIKTFAARNWAQYAETYGFPVPIIKVPEEYFKKNRALLKTLLQSVGVNRYGIFFPEMEYDVITQTDQASVAVFRELVETANKEMTIGILGQNLTTDVEGGSRAASQTHFSVLEGLIDDDLDWLDEIINDQIIPDMVALNFPDVPRRFYPTYSSIMKRKIDLQKFAAGLKGLSSLVPIPINYIYETAQIPAPSENDETVGGESGDILSQIDRRMSR